MTLEPAPAGESATLAAAFRAYLTETSFTFTGLTGREATERITHAVAGWGRASGFKAQREAPMRFIDPPVERQGGCRIVWWPSWSAYLDLRLDRPDGPPIAVEIDRQDDSTAVQKLRDEALRGHPALWIRWHGALRTELPPGVARLHLHTRSSRGPVRYSLNPVTRAAPITHGEAVTPDAKAGAAHRDQLRIAEEKRTAALPRDVIRV